MILVPLLSNSWLPNLNHWRSVNSHFYWRVSYFDSRALFTWYSTRHLQRLDATTTGADRWRVNRSVVVGEVISRLQRSSTVFATIIVLDISFTDEWIIWRRKNSFDPRLFVNFLSQTNCCQRANNFMPIFDHQNFKSEELNMMTYQKIPWPNNQQSAVQLVAWLTECKIVSAVNMI